MTDPALLPTQTPEGRSRCFCGAEITTDVAARLRLASRNRLPAISSLHELPNTTCWLSRSSSDGGTTSGVLSFIGRGHDDGRRSWDDEPGVVEIEAKNSHVSEDAAVSSIGLPHWMMIAGGLLVVVGVVGLAMSQNKEAEADPIVLPGDLASWKQAPKSGPSPQLGAEGMSPMIAWFIEEPEREWLQ